MRSEIPIEERVGIIEKFLVTAVLYIVSFYALTTKQQSIFFGGYSSIINLIFFFIFFPLAFYYFMILVVIISGRWGYSIGNFIRKNKSGLLMPFYLIIVAISAFMIYLLGTDWKDIVKSILLIFIGIVLKYGIDHYKINKSK